jgi:hypothetical protein
VALTLPHQLIGPWWRRTAETVTTRWEPVLDGARQVRAALVRLWRWLLAEPDRFRAATRGLAVCLLMGAVIGWATGALVAKTVGLAVHEVRTGP